MLSLSKEGVMCCLCVLGVHCLCVQCVMSVRIKGVLFLYKGVLSVCNRGVQSLCVRLCFLCVLGVCCLCV